MGPPQNCHTFKKSSSLSQPWSHDFLNSDYTHVHACYEPPISLGTYYYPLHPPISKENEKTIGKRIAEPVYTVDKRLDMSPDLPYINRLYVKSN